MKTINMKYLTFILVLLFASCDGGDSLIERTYKIRYNVTGSSQSIKIFYNDKDGLMKMETLYNPSGNSVWKYEYKDDCEKYMSIRAINLDTIGDVTASIYVNNKLRLTATNDTIVCIADKVK